MMNETNMLHNIVMNNNQIGRESLRREWKGLRKFSSRGQLERSGFEAHPPHLERDWAQVDRPDRPDPILPRLPDNREICSVDRYYSIAIRSEPDSEARRNPEAIHWPAGLPRQRTPDSPRDSSGDAHSNPAHGTPDEGRLPRQRRRTPSLQADAESSRSRRRRHRHRSASRD